MPNHAIFARKACPAVSYTTTVFQPWFTLVPSYFGTWKLLCLLELLRFGSSFSLFFVNNLSIYSIIVDKGVI